MHSNYGIYTPRFHKYDIGATKEASTAVYNTYQRSKRYGKAAFGPFLKSKYITKHSLEIESLQSFSFFTW
jgi:hypothetical protein